MDPIMLIDLILSLGQGVIGIISKAQWPAELITAIQAGLDKIESVKTDPVTKAQLESLRG